ncbi:acyltransferase [Streptomyces sp. NPDC059534]|uniref:acyltransferase n=1 Tax=Streptomyces sp. NPDC059534 TaxID=3346859 RepID=UPI0036BE43BA
MLGVEELLRVTIAALMSRSGERQGDLAAGLGQSQAQVSRKQSGRAHWSLEDVDLLAAHYGLSVLDLLAGPTHAVGVLHGGVPALKSSGEPAVMPPPVQSPLTSEPPRAEQLLGPAVDSLSAPSVAESAEPAESAGSAEPAAATESAEPQRPTPDPAPVALPCVLCGQPAWDDVDGYPQHLDPAECAAAVAAASSPQPAAAAIPRAVRAEAAEPAPGPAVGSASTGPFAGPDSASPAPGRPARSAPAYASTALVDQITDRVLDTLAEYGGDADAAQAVLIKAAIPDVMALLKVSRVGGRYEHSEFPPTADILRKKSQKGADEIWEGRPKWRNSDLVAAAKRGELVEVTALDMNAAYLSALKAWLPIGQLREDTSGVHDPRRAGMHLVTPSAWDHTDLPNPLGNRMEPGELWVSESTLRLLLDCARQGLADAPVIHRSLVSGATEGLLEKLRRALAETRRAALVEGDELTVTYVKAMYSKFVSTIGESSSNREIRRPDWMHIIRAKAFANLWMKAHKAHKAGLQVVEISGTDELHVSGDWRSVFHEGRDLNEVKEKNTYVLGGKR